jgi:hypothetical protein
MADPLSRLHKLLPLARGRDQHPLRKLAPQDLVLGLQIVGLPGQLNSSRVGGKSEAMERRSAISQRKSVAGCL